MRALIKGQTDGAITAVIDIVAGSLVGKQIDMDVMRNGIFKQIDNISVICDRNRFFSARYCFASANTSSRLSEIVFTQPWS